jgi:hypothetical protein
MVMLKKMVAIPALLYPMSAPGATRILVPAYFDPTTSNGWSTMAASVTSQVPITAIMNPDNGPTSSAIAAYTSAISAMNTVGGSVVGYVYTNSGNRSLTTVESAVAAYKAQYPNLSGIFVDEMAITSSKLSYYQSLYSYIKSENSNWQVIGNPGTDTISSYLSPTPAADILVTFENGSGYTSYAPSTWQASYSASSFANVVYTVNTAATMEQYLSLSVTNRAGNVYFTDGTGSNPYSQLPSYWSSEVAAVSALNGPTPKGHLHCHGIWGLQRHW